LEQGIYKQKENGDKDKKTKPNTITEHVHRAFMASSPGTYSDNWYLDSCCSQHISEHREWFTTYKDISSKNQLVEGIRGVMLYAQGIGDIVFRTLVDGHETMNILKDVVHVPKLGRNLFSTSRGVQRNIEVLHRLGGYTLIVGAKIFMKGVEEYGVYRLLMSVVPPSTSYIEAAFFGAIIGVPTQKNSKQSLDVWHRRLGHLHRQMIKDMEKKMMVDGLVINENSGSFCAGCVYGKSH